MGAPSPPAGPGSGGFGTAFAPASLGQMLGTPAPRSHPCPSLRHRPRRELGLRARFPSHARSRPLPPLKRPLLSNGPQVHADAGPLWQATRERQAATWASEARSWPCPTPGLPPGNSTLSSRAARPGGNAPSPAPPDPTYDAHKRIASRTSDSNALPPLPLPGLPPLLPWHLAGLLLHNLFDVLFWFPPPPQSVGEPLPYILLPWPGVSHGLGEAALLFSPRTTALVGERGWVLLVV